MKITGLRCVQVEIPLDKPIRTAIHDVRSVGCVLVYLDSDEGTSGEAYNFTMNAVRLDILQAMIESLAPHVIGRDPHDVEAIWDAMWRDINFFGHKGVTLFAISTLDTACWDLIGKAAGKPLYKLFGACRDSVAVYASGGLWLSLSIDELVEESRAFLARGFRAMKMRLGKQRVDEDVERVAAVRDAIGPDVALMADANQGFTVSHAVRLGRRLEEFRLDWFEEPVPAWDLEGHATVAAALDTPIASGETEYTRYGMRDMLKAKAVDILMPDLQRIGGLTEFRRVASLASSWDVPISTHIFTEQSLSIAGSASNCIYLEHMPWFESLYREPMRLIDGRMAMPEGDGLGFTFDADTVDRYRIK
ncbi:MAG: mandelate racemase/muconate lactonizing enzyme family protein [Gammaproteobacteria bacterium]|nr:MAG: mandelate racemase/muconate lactonizing enzyme family protein [Gammaproteobacteria bacterium]